MRTLIRAFIASLVLTACAAQPEPQPEQLADMAAAGPSCGLPAPATVSCVGRADGDACDDGDACTTGDACQAGVCRGESAGRYCVRCRVDADCCAGAGSVVCEDNGGFAWAPTGKCTADGVCAMDRRGCLVGEICVPGQGCK